jgi:hypothetical protein
MNIDTMISGILVCLFSKSFAILEHFRNFEETFEKSAIISMILSMTLNNPFFFFFFFNCLLIHFDLMINRNCSEKTRPLFRRHFVYITHEKLVLP